MLNEKIRIAGLAAAIFAGTLGGAFAQTDPAAPPVAAPAEVQANEDDGFDLGWLGLLGLLGLAGLSRRKDTARHTTTTVGTTGTTGSTRL